jgi:Tol biopolymer transport system component
MEYLPMVSSKFLLLGISLLQVFAAGGARAMLLVGQPVLSVHTYAGGTPFGPCASPLLSWNASYMTFLCRSDDIVVGDDNERSDVFIIDRLSGGVSRVSVDSQNRDHRFDSGPGFSSGDGRYVVFDSNARLDPVLPWDYYDNGIGNVFLRDREAGSTVLVGMDKMGMPRVAGTTLAAVSFGRNEVLFASIDNLVGDFDLNGPFGYDLYLRDWRSSGLEIISGTHDGVQGNCSSGVFGVMSEDGRYIVFNSCSSNLTEDNPGQISNLFVHDRWLGTKRRLTWPWHGGEFTYPGPDFSVDLGARTLVAGRYLTFSSFGTEFVEGVDPGSIHPNVYLLDVQTGAIELISRSWDGSPAALGGQRIVMSENGRYLAFASRSSTILSDPNVTPAIYLRDRWTGETVNVSAPLGPMHPNHTPEMDLSGDGSTLAFSWRHSDTAAPPFRGRVLIYTVSISGTPIELPEPEPVPSTSFLIRVGGATLLLLAGVGWLSRRRRSKH